MMSARPTRSRARRVTRRDTFFPGSVGYVWPQEKEEGWGRIPRNIGLILAIIDHLKEKGADPSRTYVDLLANNLGEGIVEVNREADFALRAGLSFGERGVRSWEERLEILAKFGFIKIHRGPTRRIEFIVLVHPRKVVKQLRRDGVLKDDALWNAFIQSLIDFDPKNTNEDEPIGPNVPQRASAQPEGEAATPAGAPKDDPPEAALDSAEQKVNEMASPKSEAQPSPSPRQSRKKGLLAKVIRDRVDAKAN